MVLFKNDLEIELSLKSIEEHFYDIIDPLYKLKCIKAVVIESNVRYDGFFIGNNTLVYDTCKSVTLSDAEIEIIIEYFNKGINKNMTDQFYLIDQFNKTLPSLIKKIVYNSNDLELEIDTTNIDLHKPAIKKEINKIKTMLKWAAPLFKAIEEDEVDLINDTYIYTDPKKISYLYEIANKYSIIGISKDNMLYFTSIAEVISILNSVYKDKMLRLYLAYTYAAKVRDDKIVSQLPFDIHIYLHKQADYVHVIYDMYSDAVKNSAKAMQYENGKIVYIATPEILLELNKKYPEVEHRVCNELKDAIENLRETLFKMEI